MQYYVKYDRLVEPNWLT